MRRFSASVLALILLLISGGLAEVLCEDGIAMTDECIVEYGCDYYSTDEVALYLHAFWELPPNYITKAQALSLGWDRDAGNLWTVAYGCAIGGDTFMNLEGLLPDDGERQWYECDVNYSGGYRGWERLCFSSDGLIYYTGDHYESFELMYEGWYGNDEGYVYGY